MKVIEHLLEEAKQGNIICLAGVAVMVNYEHEQFYIGKVELSRVMYALECWKFRRLQQTMEEADAALVR